MFRSGRGRSGHYTRFGVTSGWAVIRLRLKRWREKTSADTADQAATTQISNQRDICRGVMLSAIRSAAIWIRVGSEIRKIESAFPQKTCC